MDYREDTNTTELEFKERNNILQDLYHAAKTVDDDPSGNKKSALFGAAVTGLAAVAALKSGGKLLKGTGPKQSVLRTLGTYAFPAGIYYAIQNMDRPKRAITGALVSGGALAHNVITSPANTVNTSMELPTGSESIGAAAVIPAFYTAHKLQSMRNEEKLQEIKNNSSIDPVAKAMEINRIKDKKDLFVRYPALRLIPGSGYLRNWYNDQHRPEPIVSQSDAIEYNLLK